MIRVFYPACHCCAVCSLQKDTEIPLYFSADLFGGVYADPVLRRAA